MITAAAVTVDITPQAPMPLFGYAHRVENFTSVSRKLEANALAMHSPSEPPLYLISTDSLYGGELARKLALLLGVPTDRVLVFGSHTHFAPGVDSELDRLGKTLRTYVSYAAKRIAEALGQATPRVEPHVRHFQTLVSKGLFANRRRPALGIGFPIPFVGRTVTAPQLRASVDRGVRIVEIVSGDRLIAVLWGVSCHPVGSPDPSAVSSCFPGFVRDELRRGVGDNIPVLFLQGFSGDIRPLAYTRRPKPSLRGFVEYLATGGIRFRPQGEAEYRDWCARLSADVVLAEQQAARCSPSPLVPRIEFGRVPRLEDWGRQPLMRKINLSIDLSILAVNAEVVSERVKGLAEVWRDEVIIPAGCCDEVIGYWPTDIMRRRGGYEASSSQCFFPPLSWDSTGGPDALWNRLLAETAGRRGFPAVPS